MLTCTCASIFNIVAIATERYVYICHNEKHSKIYNRITIPFFITAIWLCAFLVDLPNFKFIGWAGHSFDRDTLACCWDRITAEKTGKFTWFLVAVASLLPNFVLFYCYVRIYLLVRKSRFQTGSASTSVSRIKPAEKRVLKVVIAVIVVFNLMWAPFMTTTLLSTYIYPVVDTFHFRSYWSDEQFY